MELLEILMMAGILVAAAFGVSYVMKVLMRAGLCNAPDDPTDAEIVAHMRKHGIKKIRVGGLFRNVEYELTDQKKAIE